MKITRRALLKTASVAPIIVPSALWADSKSANDRITMGLIGMGLQNRHLLQHFLYRTQVLAVCDVDTTRREDAKRRVDEYYTAHPEHGKPNCLAYSNYQELLAREDIDAVCIATPDHWHAAITVDALRAGKDVYCEKPLTHDIAGAIEVMNAIDANKRILQTGSMQRSSREFRVACELAINGAIGKIKYIESGFGAPAVPCELPEESAEPGLDWNLWLGPAPIRPYNSILSPRGIHNHFPDWRSYREYGGGAVTDFGAHHLDIVQWALGMDESGPVEVMPPEKSGALLGARLIYANGVTVEHTNGIAVHMYGTEGEIMVDRGQFCFIREKKTVAKFMQKEDSGTLNTHLTTVEREFLKDAKIRLYHVKDSHLDDFIRSVYSRKKPIAHEQIGARSAICCHLMNLAYWHRRPIKWNPTDCNFTDGTGDPRWLTGNRRDYRI